MSRCLSPDIGGEYIFSSPLSLEEEEKETENFTSAQIDIPSDLSFDKIGVRYDVEIDMDMMPSAISTCYSDESGPFKDQFSNFSESLQVDHIATPSTPRLIFDLDESNEQIGVPFDFELISHCSSSSNSESHSLSLSAPIQLSNIELLSISPTNTKSSPPNDVATYSSFSPSAHSQIQQSQLQFEYQPSPSTVNIGWSTKEFSEFADSIEEAREFASPLLESSPIINEMRRNVSASSFSSTSSDQTSSPFSSEHSFSPLDSCHQKKEELIMAKIISTPKATNCGSESFFPIRTASVSPLILPANSSTTRQKKKRLISATTTSMKRGAAEGKRNSRAVVVDKALGSSGSDVSNDSEPTSPNSDNSMPSNHSLSFSSSLSASSVITQPNGMSSKPSRKRRSNPVVACEVEEEGKKEKNKQSAWLYRQRRKEYVGKLEELLSKTTSELSLSKEKLTEAEEENAKLKLQIQSLTENISNKEHQTTPTKQAAEEAQPDVAAFTSSSSSSSPSFSSLSVRTRSSTAMRTRSRGSSFATVATTALLLICALFSTLILYSPAPLNIEDTYVYLTSQQGSQSNAQSPLLFESNFFPESSTISSAGRKGRMLMSYSSTDGQEAKEDAAIFSSVGSIASPSDILLAEVSKAEQNETNLDWTSRFVFDTYPPFVDDDSNLTKKSLNENEWVESVLQAKEEKESEDINMIKMDGKGVESIPYPNNFILSDIIMERENVDLLIGAVYSSPRSDGATISNRIFGLEEIGRSI